MDRRTSDPGVEECKGFSLPTDHTTSDPSTPLPFGSWNLNTRAQNTGTAIPSRLTRTEGQRLDDLRAKRARYARDVLRRRASQQQQANADTAAGSAALQALQGEATRLAGEHNAGLFPSNLYLEGTACAMKKISILLLTVELFVLC